MGRKNAEFTTGGSVFFLWPTSKRGERRTARPDRTLARRWHGKGLNGFGNSHTGDAARGDGDWSGLPNGLVGGSSGGAA